MQLNRSDTFNVRGLTNLDGVSCYANSSLQSILHCKTVLTKFFTNPEKNVLNDIILQYIGNDSNIDIKKLRLFAHSQYMTLPLRQQDVAEFIMHLYQKSSNLGSSLQNELLLTEKCCSCNDTIIKYCIKNFIYGLQLPKTFNKCSLQDIINYNENL